MWLVRITALATLVASCIALSEEARPLTAEETASATLATEPAAPRAGERTGLTFTLADPPGELDLMTHHGRKVHVVIVSADMQVLGHIHPQDFGEPIEAGKARVYFTFPRQGRYLVAADYMTAAGPHAEQFTLEVAGSGHNAEAENGTGVPPRIGIVKMEDGDRYTDPVLLEGSGDDGGYGVALQRPDRVEAGEPVTLTYRFTLDGEPVTDLRPYLEAPMHLAVVRDDLGQFLHEHGMLPGEGHSGRGEDAHHAHGSGDDASGHSHHGHRGYEGPTEFGPEIMARFSFPEPGTYLLFSQAAHGDRLLISRIPVKVD